MSFINQMETNIFALPTQQSRFIGSAFSLTYDHLGLLTNDFYKQRVGGIPESSFLLAFYTNRAIPEELREEPKEALLLRVLSPISIPTDNEMTSTMIEYYKEQADPKGPSNMDGFTRFDLSFSGLSCRILGTFYLDDNNDLAFGSDVENFYSPNNYQIFKPTPEVLYKVVNFSNTEINTVPLGHVRFSSTLRFQSKEKKVPVRIDPLDLVGKRTALFGMTRTGKSNTVKKIIEETVKINQKIDSENQHVTAVLGNKPVGQIIFDVNGEYANDNQQDDISIYQKFKQEVIRYSVATKKGFKPMKVNFYTDVEAGFEYITDYFQSTTTNADYISTFLGIKLMNRDSISKGVKDDQLDYGEGVQLERVLAAYQCVLKSAGFVQPNNFKIYFKGNKELNSLSNPVIDPSKGISLQEAQQWFQKIWERKSPLPDVITENKDLQAVLTILFQHQYGKKANITGFKKLIPLAEFHTPSNDTSYLEDVLNNLRKGKIIIIDLSQGSPAIQHQNSEKLCEKIFSDSMEHFTNNDEENHNFIQFYFEEAHNLFPKQNDSDLTNIYNRLAKEGAKLRLGIVYSTQEVSSISNNILKNTQNWFISHLNNTDETKELKKYYDFSDFTDALVRYSSQTDKGFARVKTLSNSFVIPTQIDKFTK